MIELRISWNIGVNSCVPRGLQFLLCWWNPDAFFKHTFLWFLIITYLFLYEQVLIPPAGKLLDVLASDSRFSELMQLIKIAEIGDQLEGNGPFTVFAPTNDVNNIFYFSFYSWVGVVVVVIVW